MTRPIDPAGRDAVAAVTTTAQRPIPLRSARARTARLDAAIAAFQRLFAWARGNPDRLLAAVVALDEEPGGGAWGWLTTLARELVVDGRIDEAAQLAYAFAEPLEEDGMAGEFALTVARDGPRERAVAEIERCLARFPRGAFAAISCGEAWLVLDEPGRGEAELRRALEVAARGVRGANREILDQILRDALGQLLPVLLRQGREEDARATYRRYAALPRMRRPANVVPIAGGRPRRNEPCPCGSGQKYKHCCAVRATLPVSRRRISDLLEAIVPFAMLTELYAQPGEVSRIYTGEAYQERDDDSELAVFVEWRMLDLSDPTGRTPLQRFAAWHAEELDPEARTLLDALDRSQLRLYEVREIRLGEGFTLYDLLDGRSVEVREPFGSEEVRPWDLLAARLFECDGATQMSGGVLLFPAGEKPALLAALQAELARLGAERPELAEADRLALAAGLFQRHRDAMRRRPLPKLTNESGDSIVFSTARFDVRDAEEVRRRLSETRGLVAVGKGEFEWLATRPAGLILGRVVVTPKRMRLETNSRERLARGRTLLEKQLGDLVWHRGDSYSSVEEQMARQRLSPPPEPERIPEELERRLITEAKDRHYRTWPDESLPALDGRTPRQAAKDPALRPKLVDLLRMMENSEARGRAPGLQYDFSWLWTELGVGREE